MSKPSKPARPGSPPLSARQSLWLCCAAVLIFAPLAPHLPLGLSAVTSLAFCWRGWLLWQRAALPPRWLLVLLVIIGVAGIAWHFHSLFGRNPGVALLALLFALKLLEMRTLRDGFAVVLLGYFLTLTQFFYAQTILNALVTLAGVTLTTAALVILNHPSQPARQAMRLVSLMLLQSAPFMLLLFVLFPRVQGPLWGLPIDAFSGTTGLSDSMAPGAISQLSQSDAIAFRAKFSGAYESKAPPQTSLYWRGPVLSQFDGRTWKVGRSYTGNRLPYQPRGNAIDYAVTLEPHYKTWLFALELPGSLPTEALITSDYRLLAKTPVRARMRYEVSSYLEIAAGADEAPGILREALQVPPSSNPRARVLAESWRDELGANDTEIVRRVLDYFRRQVLIYTLSPPLMGDDSVDEFLFDFKRGFCEHFAAAFVFMMRAAGVPARVVTGYQGGELNPVDNTLVVRQSDAHAWAEVWLRGRGWLRIDPTAASVPTRIEFNLARALPAGEVRPLLARPEFVWLLQARYRWDALANIWNQWVLGYNPQRQRDLLISLGMRAPDWQQMTAVLTGLCGLLLLGFSVWAIRQRQSLPRAVKAWNRLSKMLARRGLGRKAWEGPLDYAGRIGAVLAAENSHAALEVTALAKLYARLRYAAISGAQAAQLLQELETRISQLGQSLQ